VNTLLLPQGAVLLHVGTFKTGTTAVQGALFRARPQLSEHGVLHAGETRHPIGAVLALTGANPPRGRIAPDIEQWARLVEQVTAAAGTRVIVSSEHLSDADAETAGRAVRELGGARVHVVVTLRPLGKVMSSQWQQYVKYQSTISYDNWLKELLKKSPYDVPPTMFWQRHSHDVLVERWASVVGPEQVTVIVVDETDRDFLLRTFEELAGLPAGLLVAERETENRTLTLGEIELVRQLNIEFRRRGWPDSLYRQVVREGAGLQMQTNRTPRSGEPRITTPQWALDRAAEIGAVAAENLSGLGVRVVGDLSSLGAPLCAEEPSLGVGAGAGAGVELPVEAAREAVVGTIISSGLLTPVTAVESTSASDLLRALGARAWRRARGRSGPPTDGR
jgi:hypothetical protein